MMLCKSKEYPLGKFQILWLTGNIFDFKNSFGFWKHSIFTLGTYVKWTLRLGIVEIKRWLSDREFYKGDEGK